MTVAPNQKPQYSVNGRVAVTGFVRPLETELYENRLYHWLQHPVMRLLHTRDLTFQEFFEEWRPPYAILSHRWTDQEVSYKQYLEKSFSEGPGIEKVRNACAEARRRSLDWLWVDAICIDKSSSAELTEAIDSMWNWYLNATICIAYLADVKHDQDINKALDAVPRSEWFLRG